MFGGAVSYCFLLLCSFSFCNNVLVKADSTAALDAWMSSSLLVMSSTILPVADPASTSTVAASQSVSISSSNGMQSTTSSAITPTPTPSSPTATTRSTPGKPTTDHPPEPKCEKLSRCSCRRADDQKVIDLSPLASPEGGSPRFKIKLNESYTFFWNPCNSFEVDEEQSTNNTCSVKRDVAVCEKLSTPDRFVNLGTQNSVQFKFDRIIYSNGTNHKNSTIILECAKDAKPKDSNLTFYSVDHNTYTFILKSVYACPGGGGSSLSAGSVLLIVFFCVIGFYFMVGIAYQVVFKKASGCEILPHSAFWCALPGYIKDGITFLFCCGVSGGSKKYEQF